MQKLFTISLLLLTLLLTACPSINIDNTEPRVSITSHQNNATVTSTRVTITGIASDNTDIDTLSMQVNDADIEDITSSLRNGNFSQQVTLENGRNIIVVTAKDTAGNSSEASLTLISDTTSDTGSISGRIWLDSHHDDTQDNNEIALDGRIVFLDANGNQILDEDEIYTQTTISGEYRFDNLALGQSYTVNQILEFGESFGNDGETITLSSMSQSLHSQVVGGVDANISDFPFMLVLGYDNGDEGFEHLCGASLISNKFVLTAAHCITAVETLPNAVLAGTNTINDGSGTIIPISNIISNSQFQSFNPFGGHDVAVLELATPIELSGNAYTVDMLDASTEDFARDNTIATVAGWGLLKHLGESSPTLKVAHTTLLSTEACEAVFQDLAGEGSSIIKYETQLCVRAPQGGVGICSGDSGGPVLVRGTINDEERWFHAGATSWSIGCASPVLPDMFARTSALHPWIVDHATEKSRGIVVHLDEDIADVNFANQSTVRPFLKPVAPRWQPTNFTITTSNIANFFVAADEALNFEWNIFAEDDATNDYTCDIIMKDPNSDTHHIPIVTTVPCGLGSNSYTFTEGISEGQNIVTLHINKSNSDVMHTREQGIGIATTFITGELNTSDPRHPISNAEGSYGDQFILSDLTVGEIVTVGVSQTYRDANIELYKRDNSIDNPDPRVGLVKVDGDIDYITFSAEANMTYYINISTNLDILEVEGEYVIASTAGTISSYIFPEIN